VGTGRRPNPGLRRGERSRELLAPPVDGGLSAAESIPVQEEADPIPTSHSDLSMDSERRRTSQSADVRDGSRTLVMSTDDIIRRITFGRQPYFTIASYTPSQELLNYCLEHLRKGPITRRELLPAAIDFLVAKKANIKTCGAKVMIFYGQAFIKKMRLGEELCDIIAANKEQFSAIYREYHTDPKGPPSLKTALAGLIHVTPPVAASLLQLPHAHSMPGSCARPSTCGDQTPANSGSGAAGPLELERPGLASLLQTRLSRDFSPPRLPLRDHNHGKRSGGRLARGSYCRAARPCPVNAPVGAPSNLAVARLRHRRIRLLRP
ncbi:Hypothetical protein GSB_154369, partial [Giardia duodenalis]